jgi:hypothetical protein
MGHSGVGHKHCPKCGRCLIAGLTQSNHWCSAKLSRDVAEVMRLDMQGPESKTRHMNQTAFMRELAGYGFQINTRA